jgi:hypothetical protein
MDPEIKASFAEVMRAIAGTNDRIDATNDRVDRLAAMCNREFIRLNDKFDKRFKSLEERVDKGFDA